MRIIVKGQHPSLLPNRTPELVPTEIGSNGESDGVSRKAFTDLLVRLLCAGGVWKNTEVGIAPLLGDYRMFSTPNDDVWAPSWYGHGGGHGSLY